MSRGDGASGSRLRIVHLLKHGQRGNGSVHVAVDLAAAQADLGHEVWFLSARGSYDDLLRQHGVRVVSLTEPTSIRSAVRTLLELVQQLRRIEPDIIHAHMMSSALLGRIASLAVRAPLVATMHNSFDGHSWLMRVADRVVAVSEAERHLLLSRRYPERRVRTVLNGDRGSAREALETDNDLLPLRPSVMTLGGLHGRKAVDEIIRAFARVRDRHPEWHLNIVGDGPDRARLQDLAVGLGLGGSVHFLGATLVPNRMLVESEILAHAAHAEPFGLAVAEARAAGCAIVASDIGGVPEVLAGGAAGILVPVGDVSAFAQALQHLMGDSTALQHWRQAASTGSEVFAVTRVAEDYDRVYREVIVRSPRPLGEAAAGSHER